MSKYKQLKCCAVGVALGLGLIAMNSSVLGNPIAIGRYLSVADKPMLEQQHLLQQRVMIQFPKNILTLEEAVRFLLQFSGYQLVDVSSMPVSVQALLAQPLPEVDRTMGPMDLQHALTTLAGEPFYVLVDPVHRLISFKMKSLYHDLYPSAST